MHGFPQEISLRAMAINTFLWELIYFLESIDVTNHRDDNALYNFSLTREQVINKLEESSPLLFEWFENNCIKVNSDKNCFLMLGNKKDIISIDGNYIESEDVNELGVTVDWKVTFINHMNKLCKKASEKSNALFHYITI